MWARSTAASTTTRVRRSNSKPRPPTPFWFGGAASCAATFVSHPFDLTKVRLQTIRQPESKSSVFAEWRRFRPTAMFNVMRDISRTEGIGALYSGLSASLLRQGTYSTVRFGLYDKFKYAVAGDASMFSKEEKRESIYLCT